MAKANLKSVTNNSSVLTPDAVVSVPVRHMGIARGRSKDQVMGIRVERGPAIGVALTARSPVDFDSFSDLDRLPRVLVAQIDDLDPYNAVQSILKHFGDRAVEKRRAYVTHDGSNPALYAKVRRELKRTPFRVLRDITTTNNLGMNLDTGEPFRIAANSPIYKPNPERQALIEQCITGRGDVIEPLEVLFDFSSNSGDFMRDFTLLDPRSLQSSTDDLKKLLRIVI